MSNKNIAYQAEQLSLIDDTQTATITLTRGEIKAVKQWFNTLRDMNCGYISTTDYHTVSRFTSAILFMDSEAFKASPNPSHSQLEIICNQLNERLTALESQIDEKIRDAIALALLDNGLDHL